MGADKAMVKISPAKIINSRMQDLYAKSIVF